MSRSRIPQNSQQDIEDFLTFVAQAKENPETDSQLWENLKLLVERVLATEDKPAKLAKVIKQWCQEFGITLNRQELAEYRVNMLPKPGETVPHRPPGERPAIVSNQALISDTTNEAISANQSTQSSN